MSSILTGFDPITKEDLIEMGFKAKLRTCDINNRYDIANMSDEEAVEMIKENTYYEKIISNYYRISVIYFPSTYYTELFESDFGEFLRNDNTKYKRKPYNLRIECTNTGYGGRYNPMADHKFWADDLRDLADFTAVAEFESHEIEDVIDKYDELDRFEKMKKLL
jgi:hypothetical protein